MICGAGGPDAGSRDSDQENGDRTGWKDPDGHLPLQRILKMTERHLRRQARKFGVKLD